MGDRVPLEHACDSACLRLGANTNHERAEARHGIGRQSASWLRARKQGTQDKRKRQDVCGPTYQKGSSCLACSKRMSAMPAASSPPAPPPCSASSSPHPATSQGICRHETRRKSVSNRTEVRERSHGREHQTWREEIKMSTCQRGWLSSTMRMRRWLRRAWAISLRLRMSVPAFAVLS